MTGGFNEGGRCLCRGCGRVFAGLTAFDAHHSSLDASPWVECRDPATLVGKDGAAKWMLRDGVWRSAVARDWLPVRP